MLSQVGAESYFFSCHMCPRVRDDLSKAKNLLKSTDDKLRDILYTSIKSTLFKRLLYTICFKPGIILVSRRCTFCNESLSLAVFIVVVSCTVSCSTGIPSVALILTLGLTVNLTSPNSRRFIAHYHL